MDKCCFYAFQCLGMMFFGPLNYVFSFNLLLNFDLSFELSGLPQTFSLHVQSYFIHYP